eukprot:scaffold508805_cov48-Prasinocladus_malaysianus.AAC.1
MGCSLVHCWQKRCWMPSTMTLSMRWCIVQILWRRLNPDWDSTLHPGTRHLTDADPPVPAPAPPPSQRRPV